MTLTVPLLLRSCFPPRSDSSLDASFAMLSCRAEAAASTVGGPLGLPPGRSLDGHGAAFLSLELLVLSFTAEAADRDRLYLRVLEKVPVRGTEGRLHPCSCCCGGGERGRLARIDAHYCWIR